MINRIGMVSNLPTGIAPTLSPWSPTGEIVRYVLEGRSYTLNQLKAVQDCVMERQLRTVPGVIDVTGFGRTVKQYQILLDSQLMRHYDVTLQVDRSRPVQLSVPMAVSRRPRNRSPCPRIRAFFQPQTPDTTCCYSPPGPRHPPRSTDSSSRPSIAGPILSRRVPSAVRRCW